MWYDISDTSDLSVASLRMHHTRDLESIYSILSVVVDVRCSKSSAVSFRFTFCTNLSSTDQEIGTKVTILQPSLPQVLQLQNLNRLPEHETAFLQCQATSQSIFETKLSFDVPWRVSLTGNLKLH